MDVESIPDSEAQELGGWCATWLALVVIVVGVLMLLAAVGS